MQINKNKASSISNLIKIAKKKFERKPNSFELANNLAGLYFNNKDYLNSIKYFEICLNLKNNAITLSNLGICHQFELNFSEAVRYFEKSIETDPYYFTAYINYGNILGSLSLYSDLLRCSLNALDKWPKSPELHCNVGVALMGLGHHKEALTSFETALLIDEYSVDALFNIASIAAFEKNDSKAVEIYEALLENSHLINESRIVQTKNALSFLYLRAGKLSKGWEYYDYGFEPLIPHTIKRNPNRTFSIPRWHGENIGEKRLLIWGEQGIGDEILFASVLPDVIKNIKNIIIECEPRLVSIFQRSFPSTKVRCSAFDNTNQNFQSHSDFDFHIPIGSLNKIYRDEINKFNNSKNKYLISCPFKNSHYQDKVIEFKDKIKIGITWRSGTMNATRNYSYSNILDWHDLFKLNNVQFFNLQYGDCEQELLLAEKEFNIKIHRWNELDLKNDLDDVLSLIENLDLVIGPCTSAIWLAAALGKTTLVHQHKSWINLGEDYCPFNLNAKIFFAKDNQPIATTLPFIKEYIINNFQKNL
jgi:tetratricopeptide (TPR) repeat protein